MGRWSKEARLTARRKYGTTHTCPKCTQLMAIEEFSVGASWCMVCVRESSRTNKSRSKDAISAQRLKHRDQYNAYYREWYRSGGRNRDAAAQRAQGIVARAILAGLLTRPASCAKCGGVNSRIEAHHKDYRQPLNVWWLCRRCHRSIHGKHVSTDAAYPAGEPLGDIRN
jgi:hypothetical protein